ncbi:GntR family transcriptional regulator [Aestuariivirga litoralis]|uniref:GntR family transcriptional regulator n=1 Tax=Aestuariivirga litoralis TaxID=2650924 RepID=UPI0018C6B6A1|nr:GntR family transcriptional regulator [Aestuariivirga litoralis]MBG1232322.1 GntR family transcriptional regulator [Aestuariivirga litoralis]
MNRHEPSEKVVALKGKRFAPIVRETVNDKVYAELRRSLIHGEFSTGETLRIADLAEKFQTSTMPVRDALSRLVSEQALEALPNRSVRVPVTTRDRIDDLARARCLVEGQVILLAMPNLTPADFTKLKRLNEECEKAFGARDENSVLLAIETNHAFHYHIYHAAHSPVLIPIVESLWLQSGPYVRQSAALHDERNDPAGTAHHWKLIAALEHGDGPAAVTALTNDITRAFNLIRAQFEKDQQARVAHHG